MPPEHELRTVRTAAIRHVRVAVADLPRALRFYRDILGLDLVWRTETEAALRCGAVDLVLCLGGGRDAPLRLDIEIADGGERGELRRRLELLAVPSFLRAEPGPRPGTILLLDPDGREIVIEVG